jgi:putative restriction endonuclease
VLRVIRNTAMAREVKAATRLHLPGVQSANRDTGGAIREGAHIKPLGAPHRGPDTLDNLLCLFRITTCSSISGHHGRDDFSLIGTAGKLRTATKHQINIDSSLSPIPIRARELAIGLIGRAPDASTR